MKKKDIIICALLFCFIHLNAQVYNPVKWNFTTEKIENNRAFLVSTAKIENKWHIYSQHLSGEGPIPTRFTFEKSDNYRLIGNVAELSKYESIFDSSFMMILKTFSKEAVFKQKIEILSTNSFEIKGSLEFMSCDNARCLPPKDVDFSFKVEGNKINSSGAVKKNESQNISSQYLNYNDSVSYNGNALKKKSVASVISSSNQTNNSAINPNQSLIKFFLIAFLAGLGGILTPCVYPMIPLTVSFFIRNSENRRQSILKALIFGISIVIIYTTIGALLAPFANLISTHWIPNIIFFLMFVIFGASFLGMFELILPSFLVDSSDKQADKGGYLASFFMALTLVIVSFSCTGPIMGSLLASSAGGLAIKPVIGMFGFALAFALPFSIFALFPALLKKLPKSGAWMNSVKVVLGFIVLALSTVFLTAIDQSYHLGILSREVNIGIWFVLSVLLGFYLLGKIKFIHDSDVPHIGVPRLLLVVATFTFALYLLPGIFGAPLYTISAFLPPADNQSFAPTGINQNKLTNASQFSSSLCETPKYADILHLPLGLEGYYDYSQGLACGVKVNKPLLVDFKGHSCKNCKEMEAKVWSDPGVLKRLKENFIIVSLFTDDYTELPKEEWVTSKKDGKIKKTMGRKWEDFEITKFDTNALPYYVILNHKGDILGSPYATDFSIKNYIQFLDKGLEEFNKNN